MNPRVEAGARAVHNVLGPRLQFTDPPRFTEWDDLHPANQEFCRGIATAVLAMADAVQQREYEAHDAP